MLPAFFSSLQVRFLLLILLAVLPGLGLTWYIGFEQRQRALANAKEDALQLVRLTAANQQQLLETERQLLGIIAQLPEMRGHDAAACHVRLADLRREYPRYTNLAVVTADGKTLCSALPFTPPVSVVQRSWFQRVTRSRAFAVGNYQVGPITGKATINVALPILGETEQLQAIITAALELSWLNQRLADAQPLEGTTLSVIDQNGTIVAHYPDGDRWGGKAVPQVPLVRTVLAQREGTAEHADLDGVVRLFAFRPIVGSGSHASLYVCAGISKALVFAEANGVFVRSLIALGVVALLVVAVDWAGAEWLILRPITALVKAAGQIAAGDLGVRAGLSHRRGELGQLARAFDDMAQALATRQVDALRAEAALQRAVERLELMHKIDRALIAEESPEAIAGAALPPLRELLGVPRAIVNLFDLAAGEVEWLAAAGRRRVRLGPGVRYSIRLMGDVEALQRGEPQIIDVHALPPSPEVDALLASGVQVYMVVPMIVGDELIGGLSFGGAPGPFPAEQVSIAQEAAMQFAIAIAQARLHERVKRQAEDLERRVHERTQELSTAQTALKHTNSELMQLTAMLHTANQELEAFSYSVSHDLRSPLQSINTFSQILLEDYGDTLDAQGQDYLQRIQRAARRMAELIDAFLQLARIARVELARTPLDLTALARMITAELRRHEPGRAIEFVVTEGLTASADERLLGVVLENLLGNAWKFTAKRDQARIEVGSVTQPDGELVFFVRDNGAGFDMTDAPRLFGAFERLHPMSDFPGTGIGLATVQRIIRRHGGRIWAEGAVGQGATFYFTLS
jgi:signal transduction histidine kinase/HAMP domain-containing protein